MQFSILPALLLASTPAFAASTSQPYSNFAEMRLVDGVTAPGDYRLEVDDELWKHSLSSTPLADVRIAGPHDESVPWRLELRPAQSAPQPHATQVRVDEVDGEPVVTIDLGQSGIKHDRVQLYASAGTLTMLAQVDGADDAEHWRPLADGALVYQLGQTEPPDALLTVRHAPDDERFVRVRLSPLGDQPPTATVNGARAEMVLPGQPPTNVVELPVVRSESDPVTRTSRLWLDEVLKPGESAIPIESLALDVSGSHVVRRASVSALVDGQWEPIGSGILYRPELGHSFGAVQDALELKLIPARASRFLVEIFDLGAPPLRIARGFGARRARDIVFHAPVAGTYTLYLGSAGARPPAPLARPAGTIHDAQLRSVEPNPRFGTVMQRPAAAQTTRSHRRTWLLVLLVTLVLAVAGWLTWRRRPPRMVRRRA